MKKDIYQIVTDRIIEALEKGVIPWRKPWKGGKYSTSIPSNFASKKAYRGINYFLLSMMGYECPFWATFKQIADRGGKVIKGEKGIPVIYWSMMLLDAEGNRVKNESEAVKRIPFMKYSTVFNLEQQEGIELPTEENGHPKGIKVEPLEMCESILSGWEAKPVIKHGKSSAYYKVTADYIGMPDMDQFDGSEEYYSTLFHECIHATGHHSRLDRSALTVKAAFGSNTYGREELVAEMGASFLCGITEISDSTLENSAAYIQSWLKIIKEDNKILVQAASDAQKAVDHILSL